jgi:hypothetical protein
MKEIQVRKFHRYLGAILALFLFLQGGSGMLISFGELTGFPTHSHKYAHNGDYPSEHKRNEPSSYEDAAIRSHHNGASIVAQIHHKEGALFHLYRILLGLGLLGQIFSGGFISFKIYARKRG